MGEGGGGMGKMTEDVKGDWGGGGVSFFGQILATSFVNDPLGLVIFRYSAKAPLRVSSTGLVIFRYMTTAKAHLRVSSTGLVIFRYMTTAKAHLRVSSTGLVIFR